MNAKTYANSHKKGEIQEICLKAGTTYEYFMQLASGNRVPHRNLAERLELASDGVIKKECLLWPNDCIDDKKA